MYSIVKSITFSYCWLFLRSCYKYLFHGHRERREFRGENLLLLLLLPVKFQLRSYLGLVNCLLIKVLQAIKQHKYLLSLNYADSQVIQDIDDSDLF